MKSNFAKLFTLSLVILYSLGFSLPKDPPEEEKFIVVLDAGHGGQDPGNRGNGYYEKDIALSIVLKIGAELKKIENVVVIYTRTKDEFITLSGRAKIANDANADLFISVHCNAHSSQAHGTETFVLGLHRNEDNLKVAMRENSVIFLEEDYETTYEGFDPNSPESYIGLTLMQEEFLEQSILLADFIQKNFTNTLKRTNRGVKQAGFLVLRQTIMPSVLVETGFLTNKSEGSYLNGKTGQEQMADAIVDAVNSYIHKINMHSLEVILEDAAEETTASTVEKVSDFYKDVTFKVQIAASSKKVKTNPSNFKGLESVSVDKEGNLYKYYYGSTSSYSEIQKIENKAKQEFPSSFIVAFKDGKKVSVKEALNSKGN